MLLILTFSHANVCYLSIYIYKRVYYAVCKIYIKTFLIVRWQCNDVDSSDVWGQNKIGCGLIIKKTGLGNYLICKTSKNNSPSRNVTRGIMIIISISD
jgi:hypothetical protein